MSKAESKKKESGKPYSSKKKLKSKQDKDLPFVAELEKLLAETMSFNPNAESQNITSELLRLPVLPKCPIDKSELTPFKTKKTGERLFMCGRIGCGVICFEKNLVDYCGAVLEKLYDAYRWHAPVCGCGRFTLLNVSKSDKNFMVPYFSCTHRNKEERCDFFQWGNQPLSNKNLQISSEVSRRRQQRDQENLQFLAQRICLQPYARQNDVQDLLQKATEDTDLP